MNAAPWLDQLIVGALVIASAAFACYRLGPASVRLWMRRQWARVLGRPLPVSDGGAGCGACGDCGTPKAKASDAKVSVAQIHRLDRRKS